MFFFFSCFSGIYDFLIHIFSHYTFFVVINFIVITVCYILRSLFQLLLLLFSCSVMSNCFRPHGLQYARLSCPSPSPRVCSNSCPLSWWCHLTISSSVTPFSSCSQFFPASRAFRVSQLFPSGGQVLELQLQHQSFQWISKNDFLSYWLAWSCSSRDSQESSPAPVLKHQFFVAQASLWSNSYIHTCLLEKPCV